LSSRLPFRLARLVALFFFVGLSCGVGAADPGDLAKARSLVAGLDLKQKVGQLLLIGVQGRGELRDADFALVSSLGPGGILLFGFNVPDRAIDLAPPLRALQKAATASSAALPLLIAIDHEGGSVFRFHGGITRPPSPLETGTRGPVFAGLLGEREGLELRSLGINFVLGPVVETLTEANQAFLGNRSFGRDPEGVDRVAGAYIEGLARGGVASAAKHFPGNSFVDPHAGLPVLGLSRDAFSRELLPRFTSAMSHGVPAIMLSHVLVPAYDERNPASLSPALVGGLLRKKLGFDGLVVTDDLLMKALAQTAKRSAVQALAAGADLLMLSSSDAALPVRDAIVQAVKKGELPEARIDEAVVRVLRLKLSLKLLGFPETGPETAEHFAALVAESARLLDLASRKGR
jgi:beta-N-acetylhexosaminidase